MIQVYGSESPGLHSSRGRLAEWTGGKLEELFPGRFKYLKIVIDKTVDENTEEKLHGGLAEYKVGCE